MEQIRALGAECDKLDAINQAFGRPQLYARNQTVGRPINQAVGRPQPNAINQTGEGPPADPPQPNEQSPLLADETTTAYRNLQRVHWLTVHCGPHIALSSLQAAGIHADGCHAAACERGGVITYIHLSTRCRQPALASFLQRMPGCTSARVVDTLNDKTLVCTQEFLDLVRLLGHGCVTSDGAAQGLLSRYMKPTGKKPFSSTLADQNAMLRQHIAALERDHVKLHQRIAAIERDRGGRILELRQQISAMEIDRFKLRQHIAALEERLQRDGEPSAGV